jgi:hypothetical protein
LKKGEEEERRRRRGESREIYKREKKPSLRRSRREIDYL